MAGIFSNLRIWAEMIKISHSIFALPFAVLAMFLAARPELPSLTQCGLIVLCMVAGRSAAMTFNRIVDANLDKANPRTAGRPIPAGRITPVAAWAFFVAACGFFVLGCAGFWWLAGNSWPLLLSVPVIGLLCIYSLAKRFTQFSHLVLGLVIAMAPVAAWIAIDPVSLDRTTWLLMAAVMFWIAGFDIIYACQDIEFDRSARLYSIPARLGIGPALWTARVFHLATVAALVAVGISADLGTCYYVGVACVAVLLLVENSLVHSDDLSRVNLAFFTINGIVGVVLGGLGVIDVWLTISKTNLSP